MNARILVSLCTIALSSLALGSCGATVTDFVDGSPVGIWQLTVPGDEEATVQLAAGGTLDLVEAEFGIERCIASSGTWSAEGGVLFITITTRNGKHSQGHGPTVRDESGP